MPPRQRRDRKQKVSDTQAVALIAAAIAVGATAKATAARLQPRLGIPMSVLLPLITVAMSKPLTYGLASGPGSVAVSRSQEQEAHYRAAYVWAASKRVLVSSDKPAALQAEKRYFDQHISSMQNRRNSATAVDAAAAEFGPELGWYAVMDSLTSGECKEANGRNFRVDRVPPIGWPGTVHPHCRCKAGKPHATSKTVYTVKADAA